MGTLDLILEYLEQSFNDYPYDKELDSSYYQVLLNEYPNCDILTELKLFHAWTMDKKAKGLNHRLSFRKWLIKTTNWS
jgi:hypothetical protein